MIKITRSPFDSSATRPRTVPGTNPVVKLSTALFDNETQEREQKNQLFQLSPVLH